MQTFLYKVKIYRILGTIQEIKEKTEMQSC